MNFRTRIKNLDDQSLIKRADRLCDLSLDLGGTYFKEFMYAVAQMNIRGIKHNYEYKGTKVQ